MYNTVVVTYGEKRMKKPEHYDMLEHSCPLFCIVEQAFYPVQHCSHEGTGILNARGRDTTDSILPSGQ